MHLITRGDVDGLACAVLLSIVEDIESIRFAHPKDMQDGLYPVTAEDIIANLPYHPDCGLWFDHHGSAIAEAKKYGEIRGAYGLTDSAARLIYDYYADERFKDFDYFMEAVDRFDAAKLTHEDVTEPTGWILVSYTIDPRSGLGRFREYFIDMVEWVKTMSLEEIMQVPAVKERCQLVLDQQEALLKLLAAHSRLDDRVIISDFRELKERPVGNRFLVYTQFPKGTVEVRLFYGKGKSCVVFAVGKSIFDRSCTVNIGELLAGYGGGGHDGAGTCQVPVADVDTTLAEIVATLNAASQ